MDVAKSQNKSQKSAPYNAQCRNMGLAKSHFRLRKAAKTQSCNIDREKVQKSVARRRHMVNAKSHLGSSKVATRIARIRTIGRPTSLHEWSKVSIFVE